MRFGLIVNTHQLGAGDAVMAFLEWARKRNHEVIISDEHRQIGGDTNTYLPRDAIASKVDIVVSMGGDGTLLASARAVGAICTPLLGINLGSLGFLTQLTPKQLIYALDAIVDGGYQIEERMLLKASVEGGQELSQPYALNDIVVDKGAVSRLIEIFFRVNDEDIVTYRADGMVIATPTGSTAYSLAVGGPIMHPKMMGIIVSPISSFSLSTRPMVFDADDVLELTVKSEDRVAGLTIDGQIMSPLLDTSRVVITKAEFKTNFIVFPQNSFFKVLRNKLHWGVPHHTER
ncbi:MAG: NAD(+)/NADH kinase [candidate division Zixibacteria bacterium]|nr:NAD(+)/NADH kinase [candidate division Zixibacteria bacterium]